MFYVIRTLPVRQIVNVRYETESIEKKQNMRVFKVYALAKSNTFTPLADLMSCSKNIIDSFVKSCAGS
jgi:hypothetical protein